MGFLVLLGRICFSFLFIIKSFEHFTSSAVDMAAANGVPMPSVLVPLSGAFALAGGLSILLGFKARFGALLLIIFLVPTTFFMHKFWDASTTFAQMMHQYCFFKNISLIGASLMLMHFGSGPWSLDSKS